MYTIKSLKTWATDDGGDYQCTVYLDGKKLAYVHNDGNGGCLNIKYFDAVGEKTLSNHVAALPPMIYDGETLEYDADIFIEELVSAYEVEKKIVKAKKKGIVFRLLSDEKLTFRTINTLDHVKASTYLDKNFPSQYQII